MLALVNSTPRMSGIFIYSDSSTKKLSLEITNTDILGD